MYFRLAFAILGVRYEFDISNNERIKFMDSFIKYIDTALPDTKGKDRDLLFRFKRKTLTEMNERFNEVMTRGVNNERVMTDLIISEYSNLPKRYAQYYEEQTSINKSKRRTLLNIVGSVIYILVLLISFIGVSFMTQDWAHTWVIVVDGILLWIAYLLTLGVKKVVTFNRIFHIIARVLLAIEVMVITVAVFIFCMAIVHVEDSWVIVIMGIAGMFVADGAFAAVTKQKLAILNYLAYVPVVSTMLYIILGALSVISWRTGWVLIPLSLIVDFLIVAGQSARNKKYEREVYDAWNEN